MCQNRDGLAGPKMVKLPERVDKTPTVGDAFRQQSAEASYQAHVSNIGWHM